MEVGLVPGDRAYTLSHLWVSVQPGRARLGLSQAAGLRLWTVRGIGLPAPGARLTWGTPFGWLEAGPPGLVRLFAPVRGVVTAVNDALRSDPDLLARDPYGAGWLVELELTDRADLGELLTPPAYFAALQESQLRADQPPARLPAHLMAAGDPTLLVTGGRQVLVANEAACRGFAVTDRQIAHGLTCREMLGCCLDGERLLPDNECPVVRALADGEPTSRECQVALLPTGRCRYECEVTPAASQRGLAVVVLRPLT